MTRLRQVGGCVAVGMAAAWVIGAAGCTKNATVLPNADATLNKSAAQFRAEAAAVHPFPADAPVVGEIAGRANVGYTYNQITVTNFSGTDWVDVQIWLNGQYVVPIERIETGTIRRLSFKFFYNEVGERFPLSNRVTRVESMDIFVNGVRYKLPFEMAR